MMSNYQVSEYEIARPTLQIHSTMYFVYTHYDEAYAFVVRAVERNCGPYRGLYVYRIAEV